SLTNSRAVLRSRNRMPHVEQCDPGGTEKMDFCGSQASLVGQEFAAAAVAAGPRPGGGVGGGPFAEVGRPHPVFAPQGTAEWPDGTLSGRYGFIHALYRETLYARVPAGRGVQWHQRIGTRLEAGYGAQARELAAELALHFVHGRDLPHAVQYLVYA